MRHTRPMLVLLAVLALAGTACSTPRDTGFPAPSPTTSGSGSASPAPSASGPVQLTGPINIVDSAFNPGQATVAAGTKVEWKQTGGAPHTVTAVVGQGVKFDSNPQCNGTDPSKCLGTGSTFSFTFPKPGQYKYYCRVHGSPDGNTGMVGLIVVK